MSLLSVFGPDAQVGSLTEVAIRFRMTGAAGASFSPSWNKAFLLLRVADIGHLSMSDY